MTLALSLVNRHYALQVSDRLVTRSGKTFDPLSNKNVIHHARDAIVTIGYSGLAYLEGLPTDRWIAQKLSGGQFPDRFALRTGPTTHWLDVGQSVELIRRECQAAFSRLEPSALTTQYFLLSGWQWRRGIARPIQWLIGNWRDPTRRAFQAYGLPRYWHYQSPSRFCLSWIPGPNPLRKAALTRLMNDLRRTIASADASEALLIKAVRLAARKSRVVGPHCMSVLIPPPSSRVVRARYVPTVTAQVAVVGGPKELIAPAAFSPWVVGPQIVAAPSILVRGWQVHSGSFTVILEAPPVPARTPLQAGISSQPRPPDPLASQAPSS